jgi:hypothetical protein
MAKNLMKNIKISNFQHFDNLKCLWENFVGEVGVGEVGVGEMGMNQREMKTDPLIIYVICKRMQIYWFFVLP